jgi:hypothetical protein
MRRRRSKLLKRIKEVVDREGTLHTLRKGVDDRSFGHFDLCYFEPTNVVLDYDAFAAAW